MGRQIEDRPRITYQGLRVLGTFIETPSKELWGAELIEKTGVSSGTLYPLLLRFEKYELLESRWEEEKPTDLGRPRRRLYKITTRGAELVTQAIRELPRVVLRPTYGVA